MKNVTFGELITNHLEHVNGSFFKVKKAFIGYKKILTLVPKGYSGDPVLATLVVPYGATLYLDQNETSKFARNATPSAKFRTDRLYVTDLTTIKDGKSVAHGVSIYDNKYVYVNGKEHAPTLPFSASEKVCVTGLHFFLSESEAKAYV